ncbi:carbohydrate ABC transporter permease [Buchananella hordeovulneris]|uniref:carbohydrate ABC transporter permease n=1 Tax=Buchananella hordeovulneris TaxID=52770 RepID=UPI000B0413A5|nr:sugar ABC transporter permease [Buchananella hordeovulneris]
MRQKSSYAGLFFVLPSFCILLLIALAPIGYSAWLSLTNYDGFTPGQFVGLANYRQLLTDQSLHAALWHTVVFTVIAVPLQMTLPLVLAELLARTRDRWLSSFVRSVLFIPVIASLILVGTIWQFLLSAQGGLFNDTLAALGVGPINFLGRPTLALVCVALVTVWKNIGYFLVIYYAAVLDVPQHLYEAAMVDGAGPVRRFFSITLPGVRNVTFLVLVLSTIWSFQVFDLVYAMTGGGPGGATTTIVMAIYELAFAGGYRMGYASAIAMLLLVIVVGCSALQRLAFGREDK